MHSTIGIFQIPLADTCGGLHRRPSFLFLTGSWFPSGTTTPPHCKAWAFTNDWVSPSISETFARDSRNQKLPLSFTKILSLPHWIWEKTAITSSCRGLRRMRGTEEKNLNIVGENQRLGRETRHRSRQFILESSHTQVPGLSANGQDLGKGPLTPPGLLFPCL